ncbi:hypothetical protein [Variovorax durovernensis]
MGTVTASGDVIYRDGYKNGRNDWDINGVKYPAKVSTPISWPAVGGAAAAIICTIGTAGACGVASVAAVAMPYVMDWLDRGGLSRNPQTGDVEGTDTVNPPVKSDGSDYIISEGVFGTGSPKFTAPSRTMVCQLGASWFAVSGLPNAAGTVFDSVVGTSCRYTRPAGPFTIPTDTKVSNCLAGMYVYLTRCYHAQNLPRMPYTKQQVIDRLGSITPDPRVWGEVLDKGGTIDLPNPTVTGPGSIQGPETVRQNADGTKEVTRTTYNFNTAGNTITNTTNVTTTNYYNSSNVQTGVKTETKTPSDTEPGSNQQNEQPVTCDKYPDVIGCQKIDFDTPTGEIPRDNKDVTFQAESVLGGGSCPADVYSSVTTIGMTLKVWDWQATCNYFLPIRFILMALAAFSAVLIILPGGKAA